MRSKSLNLTWSFLWVKFRLSIYRGCRPFGSFGDQSLNLTLFLESKNIRKSYQFSALSHTFIKNSNKNTSQQSTSIKLNNGQIKDQSPTIPTSSGPQELLPPSVISLNVLTQSVTKNQLKTGDF